jgi:hypothetical protein
MASDQKIIEAAIVNLEKLHGAGCVMKLGSKKKMNVQVIPTGILSFDAALGVGGFPRGRLKSSDLNQVARRPSLYKSLRKLKLRRALLLLSMLSMRWTQNMRAHSALMLTICMCLSQITGSKR